MLLTFTQKCVNGNLWRLANLFQSGDVWACNDDICCNSKQSVQCLLPILLSPFNALTFARQTPNACTHDILCGQALINF